MGCPKIIDVDFTDIEQERIDHNLRVMINARSEQRRRKAEQEAKEAERTARMEARAKRERNRNALNAVTSALFVGGIAWAGYAGLIAPVLAFPAVCIGFAIFGWRVANAVRYSNKGREN